MLRSPIPARTVTPPTGGGRAGAIFAVHVAQGTHVVVAAPVAPGQGAGGRAVVPLVLQEKAAAGRELVGRRLEDTPVRVEPVAPPSSARCGSCPATWRPIPAMLRVGM
jgi:hypothetical protein